MAKRGVIDHPKFARLKVCLKVGRFQALGVLETLWQFTGRYTPQGNIGKYSDEEIEAWLEWDGAEGALVAALVKCGWLDRCPTHRLIVHDWHEHIDHTTKTALNRANMEPIGRPIEPEKGKVREQRSNSVRTVCAPPEPVPVPVPENKEKVEKESWLPAPRQVGANPRAQQGALTSQFKPPEPLDTAEFRDAWARWARHRAEKRKSLTPSTADSQLSMLAKLGSANAVACIELSITHGWQGLFPDKIPNGKEPDPIHRRDQILGGLA